MGKIVVYLRIVKTHREFLQCPIFSIDEPLYDLYERDMDSLYGMAYDHVAFANKIFGEQVFTEAEGLADRYFRIGRIQVQAKDSSCSSSGKKNKFGHFLVVVQLIHKLMLADISCTTTSR